MTRRCRISCRCNSLLSLAPSRKENGSEDGILVTTGYEHLARESYESEWTLHPLPFEGARIQTNPGMSDLVTTVEKVPREFIVEWDGRPRAAGSEKGRGSG